MEIIEKRNNTSTKQIERKFPIKNAFTFARELARKHSWPTFIFDGKSYAPYALIQEV